MGDRSAVRPLHLRRVAQPARSVAERTRDWREVYLTPEPDTAREQAARCMDCGIPFCHQGCPLGNTIPAWNGLVHQDRWRAALDRLHATNNFPELTGRVCPAPCEGSCVLALHESAVAIKSAERAIIDRAFNEKRVAPRVCARRTGRRIAVVGSGPAGLAAADQLNQAGHWVTIFERADRIGGLLRYGIPEFKLEKQVLDRRLALLEQEGVRFRTACRIGTDVTAGELRRDYDAIVLAGGATQPRDLSVPGRGLSGIHLAMDYLTAQNRRCEGDRVGPEASIDAAGKHVVIIGGGDTGADCLGTAIRQGARSIHQLELVNRPPDQRAPGNPWPQWPNIFRVSSAHEEGGERLYAISTQRFSGDANGHVHKLHAVHVEPAQAGGYHVFHPLRDTEFELRADLVLLAIGFTGPERGGMLEQFGVRMTDRGMVWRDANWMTSVPGVFTAGDMQRGQSLVVWAIADGRSCARGVDAFLMGESDLPAPVA